jgi:outer membrane biosynthesis protein TonB
MLEFSSISVSSYDAASLADKLTEKSGDGWSVVSVVAAGTNVTAYLSRERSQAGADADAGGAVGAGAAVAGADEYAAAGGYDTAVAEDDLAAVGETTEPTFEPVLPASSSAAAVEEPAGWAVEPEPASTSTSTGDTSTWGSGSGTADVQPAASTTPESIAYGTAAAGATSETGQAASSEPASSQSATSQGASQSTASDVGQTTAATSAATAPAGWYADPSGRYELRYWDGTQWTEHVSRAGQQYTDPPVA